MRRQGSLLAFEGIVSILFALDHRRELSGRWGMMLLSGIVDLILAFIISSWVRLPYSPWLNRVQRFLYDVCDPYLRLFRRFLPALGPLDLSPMVGVIVLGVLDQVAVNLLGRLH